MFRRKTSSRTALPVLAAAIVVGVSSLFIPAALGQTALGSIQGTVVDYDNQPVAGAQVYPITGPAGTGSSNSALTNADGRFRLESLAPGIYTLSVSKVSDGYADPSQRFYSVTNRATASISVSAATQASAIMLQMGRRCGTLHVLAEDAVTHRPLQQVTYTLRVANSPNDMLQGDKAIPADFLVPPVDVTVEFFAKGYSNWRYSENGHDFLTLRPGESRTLQVEMQPQPGSDTTNAAH
jgi:Carboxypeptidase regulatory-like domain